MLYGTPWGAGWGEPENHLLYATTRRIERRAGTRADQTALAYAAKPAPNLGGGYGYYVNTGFVRNVLLAEGEEYVADLPVPWGAGTVSVLALHLGQLADPSFKCEQAARAYEAAMLGAKRVTLAFDFKPAVAEPLENDGGFTSGWALTGAQWGVNTKPVANFQTRGELALDISVSGGNVTLTLKLDGVEVAAGTAAILGAPFPVSLTQRNGSGLSASVTVSNTVATTLGANLVIRWPKEMIVKRGTANPPTAEVARVRFTGLNTVRWAEPADLADGTYYYRAQPYSDTGDAGDETASVSKTVAAAPAPVTNLAYQSGNAAACVLSFTPSGASQRLYLNPAIGGALNIFDPNPAGTVFGAGTVTLPAITGYPGKVLAVVRGVSAAGIEEKNLNILELEFDAAGNFVAARPNTPGVLREALQVSSGRTASLRVVYDPRHEKATATHVRMFRRAPGGAYNFASHDAEVVLGPAGDFKLASFSHIFPSNGFWFVTFLAWTGSVLSDPAGGLEFKLYVSDANLPASGSLTAELTRG